MSRSTDKIKDATELQAIREALRDEGKTVVQCHGCFDIVHPGHIRYLQFAKNLGDILIVSVSADRVVGKGDGRPYIREDLRLENLSVFEFVDYVVLDDHDWAGPVLEALRPDIYVKGQEYETKGDPRFAKEVEVVESHGGRIVFSSGDVVYSSTHIINQFQDTFDLEKERLASYCRRHELTQSVVSGMLRKGCGSKILVIGDPIIDRYLHCESLGVASEQPMLSVTPIREQTFVGAGALIANQLAAVGAEVGLLTSLPSGPDAELFRSALEERDITLHDVADEGRPVAVKTRYLVNEHKVFKVDSGRRVPPTTLVTRQLVDRLKESLVHYDALIVTDFGYGLFTTEFIGAIVEIAKAQGKPYYVDVSHTRRASILQFSGARLATPTESELRFSFADNEAGLSNLASRFFAATGTEHLALTLGKRGVLLFQRPEEAEAHLRTDFLPAFESVSIDPVGAGDVFLAGAVLADLVGAPPQHGIYLGSALAGLQVSRLGNEAVTSPALHRYIEARPELVE